MLEWDSIKYVANISKGYAIAIGVAYAIGYFYKWRRQAIAWRRTDQRAKAQNLWSDFLKANLIFLNNRTAPISQSAS